MINFEKKVLDNGLRVMLAPMGNTEAVTLLVLVKVGSRHETKNINGISHFLEHMFFKGTKSRPKPGQVEKDLNKIGASYNAFTSKEMTGFWVKSSRKDFDTSLDVVSNILLEPLFKKEEVEKERGVIIQELNMYEDNLPHKAQVTLEEVAFGDQPVGWDIGGTKESVGRIKREDIIKYENENYLSENMVVAVAGNIDKEVVFKKVNKIFGKIRRGKNKPFAGAVVGQNGVNIKIAKKESDQTHFALAARSYDIFDERKYVLNLLSVILGGNTSSKLFMEIREKLGLAYYVYSWSDLLEDCGYLGIASGVPHEKLPAVARKISDIIKSVKQKRISKKDLDFAKSYVRGQTALRFETSDEIANFVAGQEMVYNKVTQPGEIIKKIEKVSEGDILKAAKDIFRPDRISMSVVGRPAGSQDFYKKIFSRI